MVREKTTPRLVILTYSTCVAQGYTNFFANISDYETTLESAPRSWGVVPAVRHAMAAHPYSKHFFYLDAHALIMNPRKSLESHLLEKNRLDSLMLKDVPVVPPDSIIKTFSHLQSQDVDLILSTDSESLSSGSFVIKQGEFAQTFLDIWFDPLYRSYNFAKAETHALVRFILAPHLVARPLVTQTLTAVIFSGSYSPVAPDYSSQTSLGYSANNQRIQQGLVGRRRGWKL